MAAPPVAFAVPAPPNSDGFAASSPGLLRVLPKAGAAPPPPPKPPPKILPVLFPAGVLLAPPPKTFDVPVFEPPPKSVLPLPGVLAPVLAVLLVVPNRDGLEELVTAPNSGLESLFCCPKLKPDILCGGVGEVAIGCCCVSEDERVAVYTGRKLW